MWDLTKHDYAHCKQSHCNKKDTCLRYQLYQEDLQVNINFDQETWCSYLDISEEQSKNCTAFISIKQV